MNLSRNAKNQSQFFRIGGLFYLLILVFACNFQVKAQLLDLERASNYYPDYRRAGYKSIFRDHKEGNFPGTFSGVLYLQKNESNEISQYRFRNEIASLNLEYDPDTVYDVSRKHHLYKGNAIQVRYSMYSYANCFEIIIGKDTCSYDCIDGACDVVIGGLEWTFSADENTERLYLYASKDFGLWKRRTRISSYVVKAGSTLCFEISRKKSGSK